MDALAARLTLIVPPPRPSLPGSAGGFGPADHPGSSCHSRSPGKPLGSVVPR